MRPTASRTHALVLACLAIVVVAACSESEPGSTSSEPPAVTASQALSGAARMEADGSIVITLATLTLVAPLGDHCLEHEGKCVEAGQPIPVARLHVPAGLELPFVATSGALPEGLYLEWWHDMSVFDPSDPLCQEFTHVDHDGDVQCGDRWVHETASALASEDGGRIAISALDLRPGGAVDIEVELTKFEFHDGDGRGYSCCGQQRYVVHGAFDDVLRAPLVELVDQSSKSCSYASLDEAPPPGQCGN